jgi:hypothetical protein
MRCQLEPSLVGGDGDVENRPERQVLIDDPNST